MFRSDIYFAADDAHAFLPWVIGIMACLATLLLCLGLTAGGWIVDRHAAYSNSFTVDIPAATDGLADKAAKVKAELEDIPGVTSVTQVSESRLKEMLRPWLGNGDAVENLPLPVVLDGATDGVSSLDYKAIQSRLTDIVSGVEVDAHERWIASFSDFTAAMQWLIATLAAVIVGGMSLMIAFTSRASLKLHSKTVHLLHSIGAEDGYITRQFQREALMLTLRGAVPGCVAAGIAYWAAGMYMAQLPSSILPLLTITPPHLGLLVVMPLLCGGVAWLAARISVIRQLQCVL